MLSTSAMQAGVPGTNSCLSLCRVEKGLYSMYVNIYRHFVFKLTFQAVLVLLRPLYMRMSAYQVSKLIVFTFILLNLKILSIYKHSNLVF